MAWAGATLSTDVCTVLWPGRDRHLGTVLQTRQGAKQCAPAAMRRVPRRPSPSLDMMPEQD